MVVRTNIYIDGFNLYYRAVKETAYKWLGLAKLCQVLLPSHQVGRIRYFTALVQPRPSDPHVQRRQLTYIRALETIPNLSVHYGQFRPRRKRRPLAQPFSSTPQIVEILDTEEKGSDVNLATYLLIDGVDRDYEQALVISNDSDLAFPISVVKEKLGLPVGVVNPNLDAKAFTPRELNDAATFNRRLRINTLRTCQFPPQLMDAKGQITKPPEWQSR